MRRPIELAGPSLEGADHAAHSLVEQHADQLLQHGRAELEGDVEVDAAPAVFRGLKTPAIGHLLEGAVGIGDLDGQMLAIEADAARKALADHLEAYDEIADDEGVGALANAGADAPGQKLRIALDIGHEIEHLL